MLKRAPDSTYQRADTFEDGPCGLARCSPEVRPGRVHALPDLLRNPREAAAGTAAALRCQSAGCVQQCRAALDMNSHTATGHACSLFSQGVQITYGAPQLSPQPATRTRVSEVQMLLQTSHDKVRAPLTRGAQARHNDAFLLLNSPIATPQSSLAALKAAHCGECDRSRRNRWPHSSACRASPSVHMPSLTSPNLFCGTWAIVALHCSSKRKLPDIGSQISLLRWHDKSAKPRNLGREGRQEMKANMKGKEIKIIKVSVRL